MEEGSQVLSSLHRKDTSVMFPLITWPKSEVTWSLDVCQKCFLRFEEVDNLIFFHLCSVASIHVSMYPSMHPFIHACMDAWEPVIQVKVMVVLTTVILLSRLELLTTGRKGQLSGKVWCGVVWCGACGALWCGVVWCGVVWCGVVWCGVVWCGVVWCGVLWCVVLWCGVVWCVVLWLGVVWFGMIEKC